MRKIVLLAGIMLAVMSTAIAQANFRAAPVSPKSGLFIIIKTGTKYSADLVREAFTKANMCGYYYENKSNDIVFDDGTIVRLPAKKDLPVNTVLSAACFRPDSFKQVPGIWSIFPNGYLAKGCTALPPPIKKHI